MSKQHLTGERKFNLLSEWHRAEQRLIYSTKRTKRKGCKMNNYFAMFVTFMNISRSVEIALAFLFCLVQLVFFAVRLF